MLSIKDHVLRIIEMKTQNEIENLEKVIGQLQGLHSEISMLAKKSPNDGVNPFKLKLINKVITAGNDVLGDGYRPFQVQEFDKFDPDDMPSNSDLTLILSQYMEAAERFRSDNVIRNGFDWVYILNGKPSQYPATPRRGKK
jgi:hypothetical protein